jgi:hypothetical protein
MNFPKQMKLSFPCKNLMKRDRHTFLSVKGETIQDIHRLHHSAIRHCRSFLIVKGVTIFRTKEKENLLDPSTREASRVSCPLIGSYLSRIPNIMGSS